MRNLAGLQLELLRHGIEVCAGLLETPLQLLLSIAEAVRGPVATQLRLDFSARLLEGLRLARLDLIHADDVIAVLRLHRPADLARPAC